MSMKCVTPNGKSEKNLTGNLKEGKGKKVKEKKIARTNGNDVNKNYSVKNKEICNLGVNTKEGGGSMTNAHKDLLNKGKKKHEVRFVEELSNDEYNKIIKDKKDKHKNEKNKKKEDVHVLEDKHDILRNNIFNESKMSLEKTKSSKDAVWHTYGSVSTNLNFNSYSLGSNEFYYNNSIDYNNNDMDLRYRIEYHYSIDYNKNATSAGNHLEYTNSAMNSSKAYYYSNTDNNNNQRKNNVSAQKDKWEHKNISTINNRSEDDTKKKLFLSEREIFSSSTEFIQLEDVYSTGVTIKKGKEGKKETKMGEDKKSVDMSLARVEMLKWKSTFDDSNKFNSIDLNNYGRKGEENPYNNSKTLEQDNPINCYNFSYYKDKPMPIELRNTFSNDYFYHEKDSNIVDKDIEGGVYRLSSTSFFDENKREYDSNRYNNSQKGGGGGNLILNDLKSGKYTYAYDDGMKNNLSECQYSQVMVDSKIQQNDMFTYQREMTKLEYELKEDACLDTKEESFRKRYTNENKSKLVDDAVAQKMGDQVKVDKSGNPIMEKCKKEQESSSILEENPEHTGVSIFFKDDRRFFNFDIPASEIIDRKNIEIMELISEGSFGTVYKASWNNKIVALKKSNIQMSLEGMRSVVREINTYRSISHDYVVQYYGVCIDESFIGIILEYIRNGNVFDLLYNSTSILSYENQLKMATQLVDVIKYLHEEKKLIHRDLKTSNVLFDDEFNIKICDFGKTRKLDKDGKVILEDNGGSPRYMAPECFIEDNTINEKSDIWGLACCLIEIFARQIPFQHIKQKEDVVIEILVNKKKPNIPNWFHPELTSMLERSFCTDPDKRPSCKEYSQLFQKFSTVNTNENQEKA
ncbi:protein kinase [Plasmodium brasilianum]|uniref:Protein kinase, putative n=2 Tax=Plasmodium (Plasmodium) TaxID=418103 RepID=A0A1D3JKE1_PLAMA|nr:protein kinase, putative [Plasmodium malariae]KAI4841320.1 protein kinase [Plasmodium brasilianum]SBT87010.1 protein kinase, putative [Plasmodium malariae]